MIVGLRGRRAFGALRREGRRARGANLEIHWRADDGAGSERRVAFAISRQVGTAVVRNRLRRRLRAVLSELDRAGCPCFPSGDYLLRVRPGAETVPYPALREDVVEALGRLRSRR